MWGFAPTRHGVRGFAHLTPLAPCLCIYRRRLRHLIAIVIAITATVSAITATVSAITATVSAITATVSEISHTPKIQPSSLELL